MVFNISGPDKGLTMLIKAAVELKLNPGEIVRARVTAVASDKTATLTINNTSLDVKTETALKVGDTLMMMVEKGKGSDLSLKVVDTLSSRTAELKEVVGKALSSLKGGSIKTGDFKAAEALLQKIPQGLIEKLPALAIIKNIFLALKTPSGEGLKNMVKNSGVLFESKLASVLTAGGGDKATVEKLIDILLTSDLKGALLKTQAALKDTAVTAELLKNNVKPDELAKLADKLIKGIEQFQTQSKINQSLEVFLPLQWEGVNDGNMVFNERASGKGGGAGQSCTINLDLEGAGKLSAFILHESGAFHVRFLGEDKELIELISENEAGLNEQFRDIGLTLGSVMATLEKNLSKLPDPFKSERDGVLDIKI